MATVLTRNSIMNNMRDRLYPTRERKSIRKTGFKKA